jgi:drug/metabolite transporter (DMT)-like permease
VSTPKSAATAALYLVPVLAPVVSFGWLGEVPAATELLGGLVGVLGVVLLRSGRRGVTEPAAR